MNQKQMKKEFKSLFRSMDFISNNFLHGKTINKKEFQIYFNIYQQLGLAWEFLGLHCRHHEGYKKTKDKKEAEIVNDTIDFYGAFVNVDVHNSYKSRLFGREINIADERIVSLKESGIECHVDRHLIHIKMNKSKKAPGKEKYGGFPWEIRRQHLKNFPVIFDYDENYQFLGLTILR